MKRTYINIIAACSFALCGLTACTDVWNEHYQTNPVLSGNENLWELISSNPKLEDFAALLEATGYDTLLTMNRSYTVWAPTQMPEGFDAASLDGASDSLLDVYRKEIVENHIANFSHLAGGIRDKEDKKNYKRVEVINGKSYDFTGSTSEAYKFAGNGLLSSNEVAKNGVLHVLDGYAGFAANIWEQLAKEPLVGKLFAFLYKDYKREFNPYGSIPGPVVDGQTTYLDSAFTESCRWFYEIGQLNREDSSYTMYALTDAAWDEMFEMTRKYFVYKPDMTTLPELGSMSSGMITDSIAKEIMCRNFVFSNTINRKFFQGECDTLLSTTRQIFNREEGDLLKSDCVKQYASLSNGELYVIDNVNYNPFTCWHDTLRVEGESLWYQPETDVVKNANASSKSIHKDSLIYSQVSKAAVGIFNPKEEKGSPTLNFYVDDILSGYYRVSIVLLPPHLLNSVDTTFIKPNKFEARLWFADGSNSGRLSLRNFEENVEKHNDGTKGSVKIIQYGSGSRATYDTLFVSKVDKLVEDSNGDSIKVAVMDTVVLAECIKIPYSEYRVKSLSGGSRMTRLELETMISFGNSSRFDNQKDKNEGKWQYDNSYRVDQVIFEPVDAPEGE